MDSKRAIKYLQESAEAGNARAQFKLGLSYVRGRDVTKDESQAIYWWKRSAINKNTQAEYCLGIAHEYGIGVEPNKRAASEHYYKAARRPSKLDRNIKFGPKYRTISRIKF